ncbi:hypothetical protein CHS0354_018883 [Potamilus streckersoni]|uniref:Uncharacterized protein n=1 Tax=Potamilus streckersoni TaxID=2493646 RepID=A0AAE0SC60_9BIVA|nr:hypothetical protein CHS0354_018883 [Potamilus streckersoni]
MKQEKPYSKKGSALLTSPFPALASVARKKYKTKQACNKVFLLCSDKNSTMHSVDNTFILVEDSVYQLNSILVEDSVYQLNSILVEDSVYQLNSILVEDSVYQLNSILVEGSVSQLNCVESKPS